MFRRDLRGAAAAALLVVATLAADARAAEPGSVLAGYRVTAWTEQDGLPSGTIWSIAQDTDGYLWLGTDAGLIRFDGTRFLTPAATGSPAVPAEPVRAVLAARGGSLWIGFAQGRIARLLGPRLTIFGTAEGLPTAGITSIVQDGSGTIWAGTEAGVYRFESERWTATALPGTGQASSILSLSSDRSLIVGTRGAIFRHLPARGIFAEFDPGGEPIQDVVQDAGEQIWITDRITGFHPLGGRARAANSRNGKGTRLMIDRAGSLWVATFGQGVWRVRTSAGQSDIEVASDLNGLSNNVVYALFEDRDGNIWAGTSDGLNRLTQHRVAHLMDVGLVTGVEPAANGNVWAATADGLLLLSRTGELLRGMTGVQARATHADDAGSLWVGTDRELLQVQANGTISVAARLNGSVRSITSNPRGGLMLNTTDGQLLQFVNGRLEEMRGPPEIDRRPSSLFTGRDGTVWIATAAGRLVRLTASGATTAYGPQEGLDVGALRELFEDSTGAIWVAGSEGLARVHEGRVTSVHRNDGLPSESLTGIIEDTGGALWIGTATGIIRLDRAAFDASADKSAHFAMYDGADGVAGTAGWIGQRSVVRGVDGKLWFLTSSGITIVDPAALTRDDVARPLRIEQVLADDQTFTAAGTATIAPGVSRLQINYSVPNLTSPRRTRFRYRLAGFDTDWIDGGRQRIATYTNLPPREYTFIVEATSDAGSWDGPTARWQFSVQPAFYQTFWFAALCVTLVAAAGWTAWRVRVLQVRHQFALLLAERTRLSRELHDTLLQSLVGVALQCDALASECEDAPAPLRAGLVRVRRQVEGYIRECRQSIWELRSATLDDRRLHEALREAADRAAAESGLTADVTIVGTPRHAERRVEEQLLRIAQEASTNAARHSGGQRLRLRLTYEPQAAVLRIDDDGHGFDPTDPIHRLNGHYGLVSMRERAESVGGTFSISSSAALGTSIQVAIPYATGRFPADEDEADSNSVHGRSSDRARRNRADHQPAA